MAENYHGKVMSMDNRQAISEATIQFFNDNVFIGGGKSALDGTFLYLLQREQLRFLCLMWEWKPLSRTTV